MGKIDVIGLDTVKSDLIAKLMDMGAVQITDQSSKLNDEKWAAVSDKDGDDDKATALDAEISRINTAIDALKTYSDFKSPLFITRRAVKKSEFTEVISNRAKIADNINDIMKLNDKLHVLHEKINKNNTDLMAITPWEGYDLPLDATGTLHTAIDLGIVPAAADMDGLIKAISEDSECIFTREISRDKDMVYIIVISMKDEREKIMEIMKQRGYTPMPFKGMSGTVADNKQRIADSIDSLQKQVIEVEKDIASKADMRADMECLQDQLIMERDGERIRTNLLKTKRTFCLSGWVPEPCIRSVEALLDEKGCYYEYRDPEEGEEVPVLTHNNAFSTPFSAVTDMYSLPDYKGFDPTDIFSIFYAVFFGIMLSDAGYGMVLAIICFVLLKKFDLEGMTYKMIKMFMICGIFTVFWGIMFGGFFGDLIQTWGSTVFNKDITIPAVWFDPMEDPTKLLIFSLLLGVVHLFVGMGINAYMLIKRGHPMDAVCDVFSWYLVIVGAGLWIGGSAISVALVTPGKYLFIAGLAILLLTGGRKKKGIIGKITGGLSAVYSITGYISDILSYARLLALGLATGVIASVVNLLGSMIGTGIKGAIALILIGIIGHIFSMAINILGAFVHSSRLQYVEFFGKFYEDGGEPFKPFCKDTKYVRLVNDINK